MLADSTGVWLLFTLQICCCLAGTLSQNFAAFNAQLLRGENYSAQLTSDAAASWLNSTWIQQVVGGEISPPVLSAPGDKDATQLKTPAQQTIGSATSAAASEVAEATMRIRNYLQVLPVERKFATAAPGTGRPKGEFTCKDASGSAVAWFVVIKQHASFRYVVATSRSPAFSAAEDIHQSGPLHNTLAQTDEHHLAVLLYAYTSFRATPAQGHQNGVLLFGQNKGFWLIHSWRRLFQYFKAREYPDQRHTKGHSFICTTHGSGDLEDIARQLFITKTNPQWSRSASLPENSLWRHITGESQVTDSRVRQIYGNSSGIRKQGFVIGDGISVHHYSKSAFSEQDIYNWIAADNGIHGDNYLLKVQAWQSAGGQAVLPVVAIGEHTCTGLNAMSQNTDHSKWSVPVRNSPGAHEDSVKFVCIGDLNIEHVNRSGGSMCLFNSVVWQYFEYVAA